MNDDHPDEDRDAATAEVRDGWPVRTSVVDHETPWFDVGYDVVERPDGETARYYWVDPGDAVAIVALTDDHEVVFVDQYRPRDRAVLRTLPAGGVDEGEDLEAAAARELREETGFRAGRTRLLATLSDAGWLRRDFGVVAATGLQSGAQDLDDGEFIDVTTVPAGEAVSVAREGRPFGPTLAALLIARDEGLL